MTGRIFDIQRFSIHDGPGIRTTVFMKGCTLDCAWCHNPESISIGKQIQTYFSKCIGCGRCFEICINGAHVIVDGERVFRRDLCESCGRCVSECYSGSLVMTGRDIEVDELMAEIEADIPFYRDSGGGVTFSGGEPLMQSEFVSSALEECRKRKIHTAVDTAGNIPYSAFEAVKQFTDMFLYDIKAMNNGLHKELTGASNKIILQNLMQLDDEGIPIRIRIPVISGANDTDENYIDMIEYLKPMKNIEGIEPLPYHSLGAGKLESLGKSEDLRLFETPGIERMKYIRKLFYDAGFNVISR
ncbi:MAG: glycyl-radical enzyme activating protein [Clostridia bacterium]|nr:glycyl-radical enzyme activating protein [Clostridia bacterium]